MRTVALYESASATVDGSGRATVRISVDEPAAVWAPTIASVSCSSTVSEADCSIFAGPSPTAPYFIEGTHSGSTGDSSDRITGKVVSRTQLPYVWAVWTGADVGAQATLTITGPKDIPG
jgi:hypothetical protein